MNRLLLNRKSSAFLPKSSSPTITAHSIAPVSCRPCIAKGFSLNFSSFSFHAQIQSNIEAQGYTTPTPIQNQTIPAILEGRDVLGLAQTGTGKTAAFALPILQRLLDKKRDDSESIPGVPRSRIPSGTTPARPRALILSPTRELAGQTCEAIGKLAAKTGVYATAIYGGVTVKSQIKALANSAVEIIVACPGRLLDLMQQRVISLDSVEILVLDEADQMCDMGFLPSIKRIIAALPRARQTLLFSATMPSEIRGLTREFQRDPVRVEIGNSRPVETVSHAIYPIGQADKYELLTALLPDMGEGQALIFTRTKHRAKKLALQLSRAGLSATALQGNLSQNQRQIAMDDFRSGRVKLMVATDIAARGIDISLISHVINFDIPDTPEAYTHRIGRTGRMLKKGTALTLVTPEDQAMLRSIEKVVGAPIERKTLEGFVPAKGEKAPFDARSPKARPERPQRSKTAQTSRAPGAARAPSAAPRTPSAPRASGPARTPNGSRAPRSPFTSPYAAPSRPGRVAHGRPQTRAEGWSR